MLVRLFHFYFLAEIFCIYFIINKYIKIKHTIINKQNALLFLKNTLKGSLVNPCISARICKIKD